MHIILRVTCMAAFLRKYGDWKILCSEKMFFIELNNREETLGHDIFVHRSIPSENQCQLALNY